MRNRWFVVCALAALIATLAACGGHSASDKNATSTTLAGGPTSAAPAASGGKAPAAAPAGTPATGGMSAPAAGGTTINVQEKDFAIALDKTTMPAGSVTFKMANMGPSAHNIGVIAGDGASKDKGVTGMALKEGAVINMGQNESITVDLKPGTYQVVCTVAGHVQLGMIVPITVT